MVTILLRLLQPIGQFLGDHKGSPLQEIDLLGNKLRESCIPIEHRYYSLSWAGLQGDLYNVLMNIHRSNHNLAIINFHKIYLGVTFYLYQWYSLHRCVSRVASILYGGHSGAEPHFWGEVSAFYCANKNSKFSIFSVILPRSGYLYMQGVKKALQKYNSKEEKE